MKKVGNWWFPDHEIEIPAWMKANPVTLNGREAYQGRKQKACHKMLANRPRRRAIDVGAHVGTWSYNLAALFYDVEAFEPVVEHQDCFLKNLQSPNTVLHTCALGAEQGSVSIKTRNTSSGDSCVDGAGNIPMRTLDSFGFTGVDFLKLDTEGYEYNILLGAEKTIREWKPLICVEQKRDMSVKFGAEPKAAVTLLKSWDYLVVAEMGGDFIMEHVT